MKYYYFILFIASLSVLFANKAFAGPQSSSYEIIEYGFGSGGTSSNESTNYSLFGTAGEVEYSKIESSNYALGGGLIFTAKANVPPAPSLTNSGSWYNKLLLVIDEGGNPSDTRYAVAISDDNWVTTNWVQDDNTIGNSLGIEDYQTYSNWGSGTGEYIIGLTPNLTYKVKVKALQGIYTESELGPEASIATNPVSLSFDIDIGTTSGVDTDAPYNVDLGVINIGSVSTGTDKIWVDVSTNAQWGGYVYLYGTYSGLRSSATSYTINSASANLASTSEGYGIQAANTSGLTPTSPFNGASENVGIVDTSIRQVFSSGGSPVSGGRGSLTVKVRASATTPASTDYSDTLTLISSGSF